MRPNNESNRKPTAAMGYGGVGAARAIEHLRNISVELQKVPLRNAVHLGAGEFVEIRPMGRNADMSEAVLRPSVNARLDKLAWWAKATMQARAA